MTSEAALFEDLRHGGEPPASAAVTRGPRMWARAERAYVEFWLAETDAAVGFIASGPPWLLAAAERICQLVSADPARDLESALKLALDEIPPPAARGSLALTLEDALLGLRDAVAKTA